MTAYSTLSIVFKQRNPSNETEKDILPIFSSNAGIYIHDGDDLMILGDLIDRGPQSRQCVNFALSLISIYPDQVTYLIGNHEKMFLDFVNTTDVKTPAGYNDLQIKGEKWYKNGGDETVHDFLGYVQQSLVQTSTVRICQASIQKTQSLLIIGYT
ncbi:metallophosphoesterase [Natribacillus halophilus]|uniref:Calcineurin-like phosphoesterase n=1 Tax=Natribacillus halophilus TaxID=549003 RepID=A0A1G8RIQ9_9BACI|nr:metallophosphoesterase [Natribacillus halophilus]SDJ16877.1 Calcineurin-like phosphoesterase [Natribacillus halophilus]